MHNKIYNGWKLPDVADNNFKIKSLNYLLENLDQIIENYTSSILADSKTSILIFPPLFEQQDQPIFEPQIPLLQPTLALPNPMEERRVRLEQDTPLFQDQPAPHFKEMFL
jgi:hypothetical protein